MSRSKGGLSPSDNPYLALQTQISDLIKAGLNAYQAARDNMAEKTFFAVYGSPFLQGLLSIDDASPGRPPLRAAAPPTTKVKKPLGTAVARS